MGMFDSVYFECPHCGRETEEQSKAGDCLLEEYREDSIPPNIAVSLNERESWCDHCGKQFKIVTNELPQRVKMKAVKM